MIIIRSIQNHIFEVRGERIILDRHLAALYEVPLKSLNLAVKRNIDRFPTDFMFQVTREEDDCLRFQIETLENRNTLNVDYQLIKRGRGQHSKYRPYAFTEQGVAMLSGIVNSEKAITMNISIMRAFVELRRALLQTNEFRDQLKQIQDRLGDHDTQLSSIYEAIENLLDEKANQRKWEERERIGFKTKKS